MNAVISVLRAGILPSWMRRRVAGAAWVCLAPAVFVQDRVALAQPGGTKQHAHAQVEPWLDNVPSAEPLAQLDWEAEARMVQQALDNLFDRYEWNSEANRFAHRLARDVSAIPPWQLADRINMVMDRLSERYGFDASQRQLLMQILQREIGGMLFKHGRILMKQTSEAVETRLAGRPFTPQQVAKWTLESDAILFDAREAIDRSLRELGDSMQSAQKEIFERDRQAFEQRWQTIIQLRDDWRQGRWTPQQWGLEDDPVHREMALRAEAAGAAEWPEDAGPEVIPPPAEQAAGAPRGVEAQPLPAVVLPTQWVAHEPHTWIAYVLHLRGTCDLDPAQMNAAWSIHIELVDRAEVYRKKNAEELERVSIGGRSEHPAYRPILDLFQEMQTRLHAILSTAQKEKLSKEPARPKPRRAAE